ncbi:hypothetical protein BaRGS_00007775 [Batillaria attramentaria]|uniref:Apple domain-containing protein n=1 Tax=Batillaria attramentaria TaxID=370345 RepID=A0ABD0LNY5_9CAEN
MDVVSCLLLLVLPFSCMGGGVTDNRFFKSGDEDVMYDDHLLSSLAVTSKLGCSRQCSNTEDCVSFTFTEGSPSGTCRLHSQVMTSRCPNRSEAPGSTTYTMGQEAGPPLISACDTDSDCATCIGFECFFGQCLCTPGYYFSEGSQICVKTCEESDLQQNVMVYANSGIDGNDIIQYTSKTLVECVMLCVSTPACRTIDYGRQHGTCNLQSVTALDVAWNRGTDLDWDFFQRACA